jgi:hypothetical protein
MKNFRKPAAYMVLAFVIFWIFSIWNEAKAETLVEVAPVAFYGGDYHKGQVAIMGHERFKGKYDVGIILMLDFDGEAGNRALNLMRTTTFKKWEAGLGFTFWSNEQSEAWNARQTFSLSLGYNFTDRFAIRWRHFSTGGTSSKNSGLDMLTVGYGFGKK